MSFTTVDIWWLNRKLSCDVCRSPNNRSLIWGFFKGTVHFEEPRESKIHKRNSLFWYILTLPFHRRNLYTPTEGVLIPIFNISGTILSLLILILGRLVTIHSLGSWNPNFPSVHCSESCQFESQHLKIQCFLSVHQVKVELVFTSIFVTEN